MHRDSKGAQALALLCIPVLSGCLSVYSARPLEPLELAAAFESRRLSDPGLAEFVARHGQGRLDWPPASWDLEQLTWVAVFFHPELEQARAGWAVAQAAQISAGARPNPTLALTPERVANPGPDVPVSIFGLVLDWPIETAGKRARRIARAQALEQAARAELAGAAWSLRSSLRQALIAFAAAGDRLRLLDDRAAADASLVELLEARQRAGKLAYTDVAHARIELLNARAELFTARAQREQARARVAQALGLPLSALAGLELDLGSAIPGARDDVGRDELRRHALTGRADLRAALARFAAADEELRLELARQIPDLRLGPGYQYDQSVNKWSLGVSLELPLLDRNQGPIAEAQAKREETAASFVAVQARAIAQIEAAWVELALARERLAATDQLQTVRSEQLERAQRRLEAGELGRLELRQAEVELSRSALVSLDARVAHAEALGSLEDALQQPLASLDAAEAQETQE